MAAKTCRAVSTPKHAQSAFIQWGFGRFRMEILRRYYRTAIFQYEDQNGHSIGGG